MVTSIASQLRQSIKPATNSSEETKKRKDNLLSITDKMAGKFAENLEKNKVRMNTTMDFERIVKMMLLLSGEADSRQGTEATDTTITQSAAISMSRIDEVLDMNDPVVAELYNKIFRGYNTINDEKNNERDTR